MQLLALALYSREGERRDVAFEPGQLNIVTGESKTGKSALLTITEYCLGRNDFLVPAGPIASTVAWYGSLWQLTDDPAGPRAFTARPRPPVGQKSSQQAMLAFGGAELELLDFDQLTENSDTKSLRRQLGRRIGIEENVIESRGPGMNQEPFEATIGHAAWLCLQDQDEIASKSHLFHRQGDSKVAEHLRDTIPYFLGAAPADAAARRQALRDAQRALRRAEGALANAQRAAAEMDTNLQGLLVEAHAAGLTEAHDLTDRDEILRALHIATGAPGAIEVTSASVEAAPEAESTPALSEETRLLIEAQNRRRALVANRDRLARELNEIMDSRRMLLDRRDEERKFAEAVDVHAGRLTSIDLLPKKKADGPHAATAEDACPLCGSELEIPDANVAQIQERLSTLRTHVTNLGATPGSIEAAIAKLEQAADQVRTDMAANTAALEAVVGAEEVARRERDQAAARHYTRGRISALIGIAGATSGGSLAKLQGDVEAARTRLERLADSYDPDAAREQLHSRLNIIGRSMTSYAKDLGVEHAHDSVRLDLTNLTVVTDTGEGPLPLLRIGSAANWIGYHLATHLAIHQFLVTNNRPVPRFLMIDQPTQAYFPSDLNKKSGQPNDADMDAVMKMFTVMRDVVTELSPKFQIIVSDHADLDVDWFQRAIKHTWRDGVKLIPADWLSEAVK